MDIKQYERFADVIRAVRRDRKLSQREMAKELKVSAGYVGQWELGLSKPSADVVRRICRTFHLTEEEYVLRLAFAESAPEFLRESIVHYQTEAGPASLTPPEQQLLSELRRLPAADHALLVDKARGWVDQMLQQSNN